MSGHETTGQATKIEEILYSELVDRGTLDPRIRRIGEFNRYGFDSSPTRDALHMDGHCYTLALHNILQGLVVVSNDTVLANVAATSSRVVRQLATTGGAELTGLNHTALTAAKMFINGPDITLDDASMKALPVYRERLISDGAEHAGEEEFLYLFGDEQRPFCMGFNRRNDGNYMELTHMPTNSMTADKIADVLSPF